MPTHRDSDDGIAAAVKRQLTLIASFQGWLAQNIGADSNRNDIIARVQKRLDSYRQWLEAGHASDSTSEDSEPWTMSAQIAPGGNDAEHVIVVSGPGSGDPIRMLAKDDTELKYLTSESFLGHMTKICHAFAKAQDILRTLLRTAKELDEETSYLSQPAEVTVPSYIRSLQEYNKIKDIGQQLVGLVAENRGVPVRSLYEAGEFGLSFPQS
ncbi:hypothetical protein VTH06DRAFT_6771 [Thermothelomyces fergusii]